MTAAVRKKNENTRQEEGKTQGWIGKGLGEGTGAQEERGQGEWGKEGRGKIRTLLPGLEAFPQVCNRLPITVSGACRTREPLRSCEDVFGDKWCNQGRMRFC